MLTDRTAAHVAAIKACAQDCCHDTHPTTWDTAALTRVVEQIAEEARGVGGRLCACGHGEDDHGGHTLCVCDNWRPMSPCAPPADAERLPTVDEMVGCAPGITGDLTTDEYMMAQRGCPDPAAHRQPADAAVKESLTTDAASAALVAESTELLALAKAYLAVWRAMGGERPSGYALIDRLAAHVTRLAAEIARLREEVEAEGTTALNYSIVIGQLREEHARLTAERDALRTACGEIAGDAATIAVDMSRGIPDFCFDRSPSEGPLRIGRWLRATGECIGSLSRRLRALAGDAT